MRKQGVERPELPSADAGTHIPRSPLTPLQLETLRRLGALGAKYARHEDAFNAISFGGERFAAVARGLSDRGLVSVQRVSQRHFRYGITAAGKLAYEAARATGPASPLGASDSEAPGARQITPTPSNPQDGSGGGG